MGRGTSEPYRAIGGAQVDHIWVWEGFMYAAQGCRRVAGGPYWLVGGVHVGQKGLGGYDVTLQL